jgi:tetratricopeptide (TPR) repeat protein
MLRLQIGSGLRMENVDFTNIEQFTPDQLEGIVAEYPWFSYVREILLLKLAAISREIFDTELRHSAVFLPSRGRLYEKVIQIVPSDEKVLETVVNEKVEEKITEKEEEQAEEQAEEKTEEKAENPVEVINVEQEEKPEDVKAAAAEAIEEAKRERAGGSPVETKIKYIPVGGDYFSREDFEQLEKEEGGLPSEAPRLATDSAAGGSKISSTIGPDGKVNFDDPEFCTETLGQVYAQQGYYEQAIEVFSKLILLYPQKSAYFAALVKEAEKAKKEASSGRGK